MSKLLTINVNEHAEKKNGLTYLSWAWAWAEVLKIDPQATWEAVEFNGLPFLRLPDDSAMVKVVVTISGHAKSCLLPVMDHRNKAIKGPDAFQINTAIMRCMTKAISMHGLGLYIYAGEDLPEGEEQPKVSPANAGAHSAPAIAFNGLSADWQGYLRELAAEVENVCEQFGPEAARELVEDRKKSAEMEAEHIAGLWSLLSSKTRTKLKPKDEAYRAGKVHAVA